MESLVAPVPVLSIVFCAVSALLCFAPPLALAVVCVRRDRRTLMSICTGAICFILGALVLESILHSVVLSLVPAVTQIPALYVLYGCLAAGLFEETARLIGLRFLCKKQDAAPLTGFAYGVGHGGIEAILLVGVTMLNNLALMGTINAGNAESLLTGLEGDLYETGLAQLQAVAAMPPLDFLAGGVERLAAIALHLSLSMLVWMVVTKRLPLGFYALAILLHAAANAPAALYQLGVLPLWPTELLTAAVTGCIAFGVWKLYQAHRQPPVQG